jgi:threonyl-tRNA synthetase
VATIQLDFNQPKNFGLVCTNEKGEREQIVMIHAAIMGSIERFMSTLIEHVAGNFPLWLSPTQVTVVPIRENHADFAQKLTDTLRASDIRVKLDDGKDSMGKRIRESKTQRIPYTIVIGDQEMETGNLTIETRSGEKLQMNETEFLAKLTEEIKNRA